MSHHKINFNNISHRYDGIESLSGINLHIEHGESVGIIGANGAGKSTLLKLMTGIISYEQGQIHIGDVKMTKKTLPSIRQEIGYTFQNPEHQLFMPTVYDDVAFAPRNIGLDEDEVEILVNKALAQVGITHLKDRAIYALSGGEMRAVAIATVLSLEPSILIMDEPSVALDARSRRQLINILNDYEHTKLIATHDLDMVLDLCSRVIVLHEGKIVGDGPTLEILTNEVFLNQYDLELPLRMQTFEI